MKEPHQTISEIYQKGKENLAKGGHTWQYSPDSEIGASVRMNRKYLDSLFFEPKFLDPVEPDTTCSFLGITLKTPVFCSPISQRDFLSEDGLVDIAKGVSHAGGLMMFGIGGSGEMQRSIDLGVKVIKIVKPYRKVDLIYKKIHEAETRGCVAVGMDIDHFYGRLVGDRVDRDDIFGPQKTEELKGMISGTRLPFIVKGVLSQADAQKSLEIGAAAVIVSNHGSAAIDFTVPSLVALPKIVEEIGQKITVLVDTGFKTGNDVLKGLAMGAKAVGFANSMLLAYAADGEKGVELLMNQLTAELRRTMAATGCASLSAIDRSIIHEVFLS